MPATALLVLLLRMGNTARRRRQKCRFLCEIEIEIETEIEQKARRKKKKGAVSRSEPKTDNEIFSKWRVPGRQ